MSANSTPNAPRTRRPGGLLVWWRHCGWALRAAVERLVRRPFGTLLTVLVLGLALAMPLALWLMLANVHQVLGTLGQGRSISVFLQPDASAEQAQALAEQIRQRSDVAGVQLKSPDDGLAELAAMQGFGDALRQLQDNPLPWALVLQPAGDGPAAELVGAVQALPGVDLVRDQAAWRQRMQALLALGTRGFALLAGLLVLAVLMVVGQTVRQDVRSRADEIAVLQLAGASARFVRRPYLHAGVLYGLGAGVVAVLVVLVMQAALAGPARSLMASYDQRLQVQGLAVGLLIVVPLLGALLGWLGARVVTRGQHR